MKYFQYLVDNLTSTLGVALIFSVGIYFLISSGGKHLSKSVKENTTLWLLGEFESTWAQQFSYLIDRVFGEKYISWKCFFRSSIASLIFIITLYYLFQSYELLTSNSRTGSALDIYNALGIGVLLNIIPDYLSLIETRLVFNLFKKVKSVWLYLIIFIFDIYFSALIIYSSINIFIFLNNGKIISLPELIGVFSVYSIYFYSTFFSTLIALLYFVTVLIMRLFSNTFLKDILEIEEDPYRSIGLITSIVSFPIILFVSFLVKDKNTNDFWCSKFPSTCSAVYRLTKEEQKAFSYLSRVCEGNDINFCVSEANKFYFGDQNKTRKLWEKACSYGDGTSCLNIGWMYLNGNGIDINKRLAIDYFQKSCEFNDMRGCFRLAEIIENDSEETVKKINAIKLYENACNNNYPAACFRLGIKYLTNEDKNKIGASLRLLKKACDGGESEACTSIGNLYKDGKYVKQNDKIALSYFENGCQKGSALGCSNLGYYNLQGIGGEAEYEKAFQYCQFACLKGIGHACINLAWIYHYGLGLKQPDHSKAIEILKKYCESGNPIACNNLGLMYSEGFGTRDDELLSKELLEKACDSGESIGCYNLGMKYFYGSKTFPKNFDHSFYYFNEACQKDNTPGCLNCLALQILYLSEKYRFIDKTNKLFSKCSARNSIACYDLYQAYNDGFSFKMKNFDLNISSHKAKCDQNDSESCLRLGTYYLEGTFFDKDDKIAFRLFDKACKLGSDKACSYLGYMYHNGISIEKDYSIASDLFRKTCQNGIASSCSNLGVYFQKGLGVEKDINSALYFFNKACEKNDNLCFNIGAVYQFGTNVEKDMLKAEDLLKKSCKNGNGNACSNLGIMYESFPVKD